MYGKPKVGDKVFQAEWRRFMEKNTYKAVIGEVVKVGRLYFYVKVGRWTETKIRIDNWYEFSEYGSPGAWYPSEQDYLAQLMRDRWESKVSKAFDWHGRKKYSTEQYEQVAKILGIEAPETPNPERIEEDSNT